MKLVTAAEMRSLEERAADQGTSPGALMEAAGLAVAQEVWVNLGAAPECKVAVLVGPGNNGGDGLVAARHLYELGARVGVILLAERSTDDANLRRLADLDVSVQSLDKNALRKAQGEMLGPLDEALAGADAVLDAVLGTGRARPLEGVIAAALGVLLAGAISWSRIVERSIYPIVIASQTIPIIALAPLLLVWVGPEMTSKVIVVVLISFFPIVVSVADGLRSADREMIDMMRTLGATRWQVMVKLKAPLSLPGLFSGLKVAAVTAVIGAVVGEWVGGQGGLGWLMKVSGPQFQTARVFAAIVVLSAFAILFFAAVVAAERWALRRHGPREA